MTQYFYKWFHSTFYPENICVDTKIIILCQLEVTKLDLHGGHLNKLPKPISCPKIIHLNISNNIPRKPLIKMESGGGAW